MSESRLGSGASMEIAISKSLEAFVRRKVEEGHYAAEAEVVGCPAPNAGSRRGRCGVERERLKDALDRGYEDVSAARECRG
jgi:hypothetical protein